MAGYDLVVIGSGPGGYVAAVRAAQKGLKVAVIEAKQIGGACLNVGCIPSKSYLKHAHWVLSAEEAAPYGFQFTKDSFSFEKLVNRKNQVVKKLQGGIHYLFKNNGVTYIEGKARFQENHELMVGTEKITYRKILLATGGHPFVPIIPGLEQVSYLTTDTFFDEMILPEKLVIIGGGVIAVELAFAMNPLGVEVSLIEVAPDILLTEEEAVRELIKKKLQTMGIDIMIQAEISEVKEQEVILKNGTKKRFDQLLIATGRKPNLELANQLGIKLSEGGRFVKVDPYYETSRKGVYAIGDLIGGYQLAHAASAEGLKAVEAICGTPVYPVEQEMIPRCLYTDPEVASFGLSEEEARKNYEVVVQKVAFSGNGKAIASQETEGFVKIISETKYHQIVGAVIVGSHATELIHTILAVKKAEGTIDELAAILFAHPSLSEVIGEAANEILRKPFTENEGGIIHEKN